MTRRYLSLIFLNLDSYRSSGFSFHRYNISLVCTCQHYPPPPNVLNYTELSLDAFSPSPTWLFFQLLTMLDSSASRLPSHLLWGCFRTLGRLSSLNLTSLQAKSSFDAPVLYQYLQIFSPLLRRPSVSSCPDTLDRGKI